LTDQLLDSPIEYGIYVSKSDLVAAALRELIMTGGLEPGTPLRQRQLAARFGVSATPVREALRRLESEGLITNDVHRGSTVAHSAGDLHEKVKIRAALEGLGAGIAAAKITVDDIAELRKLNDRLLTPGLGSRDVASINRRFHFRIYELADSPLLLTLMRLLWQSFPGGPQVRREPRDSHAEHAALLSALEQRDGETASQITQHHILSVLDEQHRALAVAPSDRQSPRPNGTRKNAETNDRGNQVHPPHLAVTTLQDTSDEADTSCATRRRNVSNTSRRAGRSRADDENATRPTANT
jgi:DNA-binding GntR family transcriptional regulator